jgi:hypothetical protein
VDELLQTFDVSLLTDAVSDTGFER